MKAKKSEEKVVSEVKYNLFVGDGEINSALLPKIIPIGSEYRFIQKKDILYLERNVYGEWMEVTNFQ